MTDKEYTQLKTHLQDIVNEIPVRWGQIQNDDTDAHINMFEHHSFQSLNRALDNLGSSTKDYFRKRWFLWKCAQCDEFLFYSQDDVRKNPNSRDQSWDFEFLGRTDWRFDLKGTVVPRSIREQSTSAFPENPMEIIRFNYDRQSRGVRQNFQNRLFVVHIPQNWTKENQLRVCFDEKRLAYTAYVDALRKNSLHKFFQYKTVLSDIIFLKQKNNGEICYGIASMKA